MNLTNRTHNKYKNINDFAMAIKKNNFTNIGININYKLFYLDEFLKILNLNKLNVKWNVNCEK